MWGKAVWIATAVVGVAFLVSAMFTGRPSAYLPPLMLAAVGAMHWVITRSFRHRAVPAGTGVSYGTLPGADRFTAWPAGLVFAARIVYIEIAGALIYLPVGLAYLAAGIAEATSDRPLVALGVVWLCGSGVLAFVGVRALFVSPGGVALLPEGIYLRLRGNRAWIRWHDLAQVHLGAHSGQLIIILRSYSPGQAGVASLSPWGQRFRRAIRGTDAEVAGGCLNANPEEVVAAITHYWRNPPAREQLAVPAPSA